MTAETYSETTSSIGRHAAVLAETVRSYADMGLIDFIRLPSGVRLFRPSVVEQVRAIYIQRMANRGRPRRAVAA